MISFSMKGRSGQANKAARYENNFSLFNRILWVVKSLKLIRFSFLQLERAELFKPHIVLL
jgi:hypothetical protein